MRPTDQLTPYPVLAAFRDDYLNAAFNAEVRGFEEFGSLRVQVGFELREPYLKRLISDGRAEYAVHVECPSSSYREYFRTREDSFSKTLDRGDVRKYVEVCTFIVARDSIAGFRSPNFHPDYEGVSFDIRRGDILAVGQSRRIDIKEADDMSRRASILNVMRAEESQRDSMSVNTDGESSVLISLRPDVYDAYALLGDGEQGDLVLSLVILPALQAVLARMKEVAHEPAYTEREWFKSIAEILGRSGLTLDDISAFDEDRSTLAIAQRMLNEPLNRSLTGLLDAEMGDE